MADVLKLTCKLLTGQQFEVTITSNATVEELWTAVEAAGGPPADQQSLSYVRDDDIPARMTYDRRLSDYGLKNGSVILVRDLGGQR